MDRHGAAIGKALLALAAAGMLALPAAAQAQDPQAEADQARWKELVGLYFDGRQPEPAGGALVLEAPARAADAAIVPVTLRAGPDAKLKRLHLIVDDNPVPRALLVELGPRAASAALETRVRVDEYTHIHAVAETEDGRLVETSAFVKASGGCSAPALKDPAQAASRLGRMKLNLPAEIRAGQPARAQLLVSHPNSSGLQFDQISRSYIAPHYVERISVRYNGESVAEFETDISVSEDPSLHFSFLPDAAGTLEVEVRDSKGGVFRQEWPVSAGPA
ncbi:MAG TPA: quinoprotein dehydrogenase-associated SoxYZ-like carrier [Azospirillaceae bacterium]|nr:quinoprotein dehydrogenase-associated SoxYZ-like carrier [Azospirillaceae bacterium]